MAFVPTSKSGTLVPYAEIPEDVVAALEDAAEKLLANSGRIHIKLADTDEKALFSQYAVSWASQRPNGKLVFKWSPTRGNQPTEGDFTIKRDVTNSGDTNPNE